MDSKNKVTTLLCETKMTTKTTYFKVDGYLHSVID